MRKILTAAVLLAVAAGAFGEVVGWRNDGSGCYPAAAPPTNWEGGVSLKAFTVQTARPAGDVPSGRSLEDGVIRTWLILGPVDAPKDATGETEIVKGEAEFAPDAGEKLGEAVWKEITSDEAFLNLAEFFGQKTDVAAYLHAYLWSPADTSLAMSVILGGRSVVWVNGKAVFQPRDKDMQCACKNVALPLNKGWNRLLIRTMPSTAYKWYAAFVYPILRGDPKGPIETKNVLWATSSGNAVGPVVAGERMIAPLGGAAAPIVVGSRLFLQSEPYDLVCLDKNTGKVLWARSNNYYEATPEAERKATPEFEEAGKLAAELNTLNEAWASPEGLTREQLLAKDAAQKKLYETMRKIDETKYTFTKEQDLGMAGFVPTSDGKQVWAWYVSGIAACYDLEGNRKWIALDNRGAQHHGFSTSPLLLDGKLIVYMDDLRALDAQTGKQLWVQPICKNPKDHWYAAISGSLCPLEVGGVAMFVTPNGDIDRASDGEKMFGDGSMSGGLQRPSPIAHGDTVFKLDSVGTLHILKLPALGAAEGPKEPGGRLQPVSHLKVKQDTSAYRFYFGDCWMASPIYHDGLVYCLHDTGLLSVVDAEKGEVVYRKLLDVDEFTGWGLIRPSLAMAGGHLYALSCTGTCVVFEPGREFKQVAKNRVTIVVGPGQWWQRFERFTASPVFDGQRVYLRGEANLYCIGK